MSMILDSARELEELIREWRRDFHAHPELSFQEVRTANIVANELRELGLEVQTGVGVTGVVGHIGEGSPVIGIRADMDALPIQEENDVPYRSQNDGVMHACGHDAHTAILLATARMLVEMEDRPPGEIRLLFQPSEEAWDDELKSGATRMIEDHALDGVDKVIALHVASHIPAGQIDISGGYVSAAVDRFTATITAMGGHGAYPHKGRDPLFILAQVINIIYGIRARRIDPVEGAVISLGEVKAGSASNVIPSEVYISGTIRSFNEEVRQQLRDELEAAFAVSRALGGDYTLNIEHGYPPGYNDPDVAALIREVAEETVGPENMYPTELGMGAEDFSYMSQAAPGAMFFLGAKFDEKDRPHHTPEFDLDETAFPVGAAIFVETVRRLLLQAGDG